MLWSFSDSSFCHWLSKVCVALVQSEFSTQRESEVNTHTEEELGLEGRLHPGVLVHLQHTWISEQLCDSDLWTGCPRSHVPMIHLHLPEKKLEASFTSFITGHN